LVGLSGGRPGYFSVIEHLEMTKIVKSTLAFYTRDMNCH
jgi:hypothetical protein